MDVTESNDGFKCYEETIRLKALDDESLDHENQTSLESQYNVLNQMLKKDKESLLDAYYCINFGMNQPNITKAMRAQVVDWMQQLSMEHQFKRETFYLAVDFLDTYLCKKLEKKETF